VGQGEVQYLAGLQPLAVVGVNLTSLGVIHHPRAVLAAPQMVLLVLVVLFLQLMEARVVITVLVMVQVVVVDKASLQQETLVLEVL
jgi:hypothetical protein